MLENFNNVFDFFNVKHINERVPLFKKIHFTLKSLLLIGLNFILFNKKVFVKMKTIS